MREVIGIIKTHPAVFAVENEYQIMVPVREKCLMWVTVDGIDYFDASNGINRSETLVHRMTVPIKALDAAKKYTLSYRKVIERKPYFPKFEETVSTCYDFKPIESENINIYLISDTHNLIKTPIGCAKSFEEKSGKKIDLVVLNGDVPNDCGRVENFDTVYEIVSGITEGTRPAVFSRGNHDFRGYFAEAFADFTPAYRGNTYYKVKLGALWALLVDCGEDKPDTHAEYGGAVSCHSFRLAQTDFIKEIIKNAEHEYNAPGVKYKVIISHVPFPCDMPEPFNIEPEIYTEWCTLIRENIKPHFMLCGHLHDNFVGRIGGKLDKYGQPCHVVVACEPTFPNEGVKEAFIGASVEITPECASITYNSNDGEIIGKEKIEL